MQEGKRLPYLITVSSFIRKERTQPCGAGLLISAIWKGKVKGSQVRGQLGKPSQTLSQNSKCKSRTGDIASEGELPRLIHNITNEVNKYHVTIIHGTTNTRVF